MNQDHQDANRFGTLSENIKKSLHPVMTSPAHTGIEKGIILGHPFILYILGNYKEALLHLALSTIYICVHPTHTYVCLCMCKNCELKNQISNFKL